MHQIYIDELRVEKKYINHSFVVNFVNELPLTLQMYSLNFAMRQRKQDIVNTKMEEAGMEATV
jgi:hypothetical protein